MIKIGIDPGTDTGIAVWNTSTKQFISIKTIMIHQALECVLKHHHDCIVSEIEVVCEDARKLGGSGAKAQGAGSIKRDCVIWQDFLTDSGIAFEMVDPKTQTTKMESERFNRMTGWDKATNEHGRDAAMMVFNHR